MHLYEKKLSTEKIYEGKILNIKRDTVQLENGETALREVIMHPGGVCVAALDDENNLLFVKQYRYPYEAALLELPAGKLNYGNGGGLRIPLQNLPHPCLQHRMRHGLSRGKAQLCATEP